MAFDQQRSNFLPRSWYSQDVWILYDLRDAEHWINSN